MFVDILFCAANGTLVLPPVGSSLISDAVDGGGVGDGDGGDGNDDERDDNGGGCDPLQLLPCDARLLFAKGVCVKVLPP